MKIGHSLQRRINYIQFNRQNIKTHTFRFSFILRVLVMMNTSTTKVLEKTYNNLSNSGAYLGPDKLDKVLKFKGITHIGKTSS